MIIENTNHFTFNMVNFTYNSTDILQENSNEDMEWKMERVEKWVKKVQDYALFNKLLLMKIELNREIRKTVNMKINRKENDLFLLKQLGQLRMLVL